jgi:hypothetical protein
MTPEQIAKVAHEVNRAYCISIGDDSRLAWEDAEIWQKDSAVLGVNFHVAKERSVEEFHESWMDEKLSDGWKLGPVKDSEKKEHPCMVPFHELPKEQQSKDYIFRAVVTSLLKMRNPASDKEQLLNDPQSADGAITDRTLTQA